MLCLNKFLISTTPSSLSNPPNSQIKFSTFRPKIKTHEFFHIPQAYYDDGSANSYRKTLSLPPNVETVTSPSNPFVKHCVKLRQNSSYRHFHGLVLVVGSTPIRNIETKRAVPAILPFFTVPGETGEGEIYSFHKTLLDRPIIEYLLVLENYHIPEEIYNPAIRIVHVSSAVIRKISGVQSIDSVEVIALVKVPPTFYTVSNNTDEEDCRTWFPFPHRILVLDRIQDPGNLGTLLRSATAFKWDGIFLLPGCCDPFNEKALRASRGACFQIPIVSGNWKHIETLKVEFQMKLFAGHPPTNDELNPEFKLSKDFADSVADVPLCLVLGSEGGGLSEVSRNACQLLSIPMPGEFESLNVSVAGGIFMYMLQCENDRVG